MMRVHYFIDYRLDVQTGGFVPIGVWMHNPNDGDVDIFYPDESCSEYEEAMWVINRLVEGDLKTPPDFLEFHQQRAGYRGMGGIVKEADTELGYDEFGRHVLMAAMKRESDASAD